MAGCFALRRHLLSQRSLQQNPLIPVAAKGQKEMQCEQEDLWLISTYAHNLLYTLHGNMIYFAAFGIPPALWPVAYRPKAGVV